MQEYELAQILANMGEYVQPHSPLNPHTEEELQEHSAHGKSAFDELCDEEEEEEDHSAHDENVYGEKSEKDKEQEKPVPSQNTSEEFHNEEEVEEEATQETAEQTGVSTPEKPDQQNIEEVPQEENKEICQGEGTISEVQSLGLSKRIFVPSTKQRKLKYCERNCRDCLT